jgi:hypothetical protein
MKKLLATLAIAALIGSLAPSAFATPRGRGRSVQPIPFKSLPNTTIVHVGTVNHSNVTDYHLRVGIHFEHGIYYKGKEHPHWALCRYDARYGCDCYWDPCSLTWYYWCEPDLCYYPVTYVPYRAYAWTPAAAAVVPVSEIPSIPAPLVFRP